MTVYVIQCEATRFVKIGFARDPWARFSKIQSDNPGKLEMLALVDGTLALEKELHQRFVSANVRGEWFRVTKEISAWLASLPEPPMRPRRRPKGALDSWLSECSVSRETFANALGISLGSLSRICCGKQNISLAFARRVEIETGGEVKVCDLEVPEAA